MAASPVGEGKTNPDAPDLAIPSRTGPTLPSSSSVLAIPLIMPTRCPVTSASFKAIAKLSDISASGKRRVHQRALALGHPESEADELAKAFSGHSLRAGYCTAAAMAGVPEWKIRRRSRHRTAEMVARYVRAAEE